MPGTPRYKGPGRPFIEGWVGGPHQDPAFDRFTGKAPELAAPYGVAIHPSTEAQRLYAVDFESDDGYRVSFSQIPGEDATIAAITARAFLVAPDLWRVVVVRPLTIR